MSHEKAKALRDFFNSYEDEVSIHKSFGLNWSAKGCGFGQFYFYEKDGKIFCQNEYMGKEFIKRIMCQLVDQCELEDVRDDNEDTNATKTD